MCFTVFVISVCVVLLVSLSSTYALETPTPVEIRIFDFELKDEISLTSDVEFELGIEKDQGILTNNDGKHIPTFTKVNYISLLN